MLHVGANRAFRRQLRSVCHDVILVQRLPQQLYGVLAAVKTAQEDRLLLYKTPMGSSMKLRSEKLRITLK